jgi:hypothetical protein
MDGSMTTTTTNASLSIPADRNSNDEIFIAYGYLHLHGGTALCRGTSIYPARDRLKSPPHRGQRLEGLPIFLERLLYYAARTISVTPYPVRRPNRAQ